MSSSTQTERNRNNQINIKKIKNKRKLILHCCGVPGSGKSQLVRALAKKFPYFNATSCGSSKCIKWHIQCKDTGDDLQKEFQHLMERLHEQYFTRVNDIWQNMENEFRKNQANKFVEMLLNCKVPILIILEDPNDKDKFLLQDFFRHLDKDFQENICTPFHVYVTSRIKSPIIAPMMSQYLEGYEVINVVGFNQEEGVNFLERFEGEVTEAREDLIEVYKRFSGMPLGMLAAKGYCQYAEINYKKYLKLVNDNDCNILFDEKEAILQEYGQSAEHIFQAVVMPFMPEETTGFSANPNLHWQVLRCISNFRYDRLPRFLLETCFHLIRKKKVKNPDLRNEVDTGILVRKLVEHGMCAKAENGQFITFHEVVLNAFRFQAAQSIESFDYLKKAMELMCALASHDRRKKENFDRMCMLRPHLQALLQQIKSNEKFLENVNNVCLLKAITSRLYELAGIILLSETCSEESENMFKKSLETIWQKMLEIIDDKNQSTEEIAQMIFDESQVKGKQLPEKFILSYASVINLRHFDKTEHDFSRSQSKCNYNCIETILQNRDSKQTLINELQKCGLFLSDEKFRPIFFAERVTSILHGWSTYCLHNKNDHSSDIELGLKLSSLNSA